MSSLEKKVAVVTGASSGIGAAIAEELVKQGMIVVGLARRKEKLIELSKKLEGSSGKLYALQADVTVEEDILNGFKWINDTLGAIHVMVNNAGLYEHTKIRTGCTKTWKKLLDTNVLGLCIGTREAIKNMQSNNVDGHIIHLNSIAGHTLLNTISNGMYTASKHTVTALTKILQNELVEIKSKIKLTSISPGLVKTDILLTACLGNGGILSKEDVEDFFAISLKVEDIVDCVLFIIKSPPHVQKHAELQKKLRHVPKYELLKIKERVKVHQKKRQREKKRST